MQEPTAETTYQGFIANIDSDLKLLDKWLAPKKFLGKGADSYVFREGNKVLKFFEGSTEKGNENQKTRLELYKKITNETAKKASDKNWTLKIKGKEIPIRFNPIEEIYWNERFNCWVTVSNFIDGERLEEDPALEAVNLSPDEASNIFNGLNTSLAQEFAVEGIKVSTLNTKLTKGVNGDLTLVVTDISTHLDKLSLNPQ